VNAAVGTVAWSRTLSCAWTLPWNDNIGIIANVGDAFGMRIGGVNEQHHVVFIRVLLELSVCLEKGFLDAGISFPTTNLAFLST
jgi:hypothetical protein